MLKKYPTALKTFQEKGKPEFLPRKLNCMNPVFLVIISVLSKYKGTATMVFEFLMSSQFHSYLLKDIISWNSEED
jgi:hypothetical protein